MNPRTANLVIFVSLWFLLACAAGAMGALRNLPWPVLPAIFACLSGAALTLALGWSDLRSWLHQRSLTTLILLHIARLLGLVMLQWEAAAKLRTEFATAAAWGEAAVASAALIVALLPLRAGWARLTALAWCAAGVAQLVYTMVNMARLTADQPLAMLPMGTLPLCLLPTFLWPIMLALHVVIARRLLLRNAE